MEKHPERTRQVLINAAADLIAQGRFADAGLVNICRTAGVSRGALYHHFDSIAGLVAEVYSQALVRVDSLFEEAFNKPASEAPAEFSIALGAALLEENLVRAGIQIGADGTNDPPRLRERTLAEMRRRLLANASEDVEGAGETEATVDLAVVITAGLESLGHTDTYWWEPETAQRIWDIIRRPGNDG
ncbi:hypothetical protein SUDANB6_05854 [Streptomyces sp. enrichment culture]|uniref:TetR family transcriptional regulator n=1 Tax=Streptomyces sp. enrichment culture TaxID=1795815 RepID=UPI003F579AEF